MDVCSPSHTCSRTYTVAAALWACVLRPQAFTWLRAKVHPFLPSFCVSTRCLLTVDLQARVASCLHWPLVARDTDPLHAYLHCPSCPEIAGNPPLLGLGAVCLLCLIVVRVGALGSSCCTSVTPPLCPSSCCFAASAVSSARGAQGTLPLPSFLRLPREACHSRHAS